MKQHTSDNSHYRHALQRNIPGLSTLPKDKPWRILYVHRTQGVGAEGAHIMGMYEAFAEQGHHLDMFCLPGCNPVERENDFKNTNQLKIDSIRISKNELNDLLKVASQSKPGLIKKLFWFIAEKAPQEVFELLELCYNIPLFFGLCIRGRKFKPELIYERYALNTFGAALYCRIFKIPLVLEVNDSVVIERSRPLKWKRLATALEGFCLRSARLCITITKKFKHQLLERFDIPDFGVLVFPNAVSKKRFDQKFNRKQLRQKLGIDDTTSSSSSAAHVIGCSGQFLSWHGLEELIDVLGPEAENRNLKFLFVGDGPARIEVEAKAKKLGLSKRVIFTGMLSISQVPEYLACFDIAVLPKAAPHASPMKLMEYMALGLPLVAVDMPAIRDLASDKEALFFPLGDTEALKKSVFTLLENPDRAKELGEAAKAKVFSNHTWDSHARELIEVLSA